MPHDDKNQVHDLALDLHHAILHLLRGVREDDQLTGLPPAQLSVLSVVVFGGPRRLGDLAKLEQVSAPALSRVARELEKRGLVSRQPDPKDRRVWWLDATDKARDVMVAARDRRVSRIADALRTLTADDMEILQQAAPLLQRMSRHSMQS